MIRTQRNLYRGVNPHLNSILQLPGNPEDGPSVWPSFHKDHITHISDFLNAQLPPRYVARSEQALQIRTDDFDLDLSLIRRVEPDVTIYEEASSAEAPGAVALAAAVQVWTAALEETMDVPEDFAPAVVIRDTQSHSYLGNVVTRIELLSPSNKPGRAGYLSYRRGRNEALYSHIPLVELDYLHETPPPLRNYPIYPYQPGSYAYSIFVSDPRPSVKEGRLRAYRCGVNAPIPVVAIPLADNDTISFDFGQVYQHTYITGRWGRLVDYSQLPDRFDSYSPTDQARIQARMAAIAEAQTRGEDLENLSSAANPGG